MIEFIAAGNCDVLILWEVSRGDREMDKWTPLLTLCRKMGVLIHVINNERTYDPSKPGDRKDLLEDGVDAEYETEKTRDRILRDVRANAIEGRPHGKRRFGYTRVYDDTGSLVEVVINEEQADILREYVRRMLDGDSQRSIEADFEKRGLVSDRGNTLNRRAMNKHLRNPAYIGKRVHQGSVVGDAIWPAILDEKDFEKINAILDDPSRRTNEYGGIARHLLSGIARCGKCNGKMHQKIRQGKPAYVCNDRSCTKITVERLDSFVTEKVRKRHVTMDVSEIEDEDQDQARAMAKKELAALEQRLEEFTTEALAGRLSAVLLGRMEADLTPKIEDARTRSKAVSASHLLHNVIENPEIWEDMTLAERRETIRDMCTIHVDQYANGRGKKNYDTEDRVRLVFFNDKVQDGRVIESVVAPLWDAA